MKKSELIEKLRCNLFGKAKDIDQAGAYMQACIQDLPTDYQGELWIALGIAMNTLANEIEKLED